MVALHASVAAAGRQLGRPHGVSARLEVEHFELNVAGFVDKHDVDFVAVNEGSLDICIGGGRFRYCLLLRHERSIAGPGGGNFSIIFCSSHPKVKCICSDASLTVLQSGVSGCGKGFVKCFLRVHTDLWAQVSKVLGILQNLFHK